MVSLLVGALVLAAGCGPADRAIVAEVYYDAPGDDTGQEFVELFNPTANAIALAGVRIEAGDGAGAGRWTLRWTGGSRDSIAAGARFVVGGARVDPPPQAILNLDLQNGPDAVRLVWPDGAIEVVGWGAIAFPEYSCGAPAADAPAGFSLARVPDASRLGDNALDFRVATPSPGRANQPGRDAAIVAGSLALDPPRPSPGASARLTGLAINRGAQALAPGELGFTVEDEPIEEGDAPSTHARFRAGSSADTRRSRSGPVLPIALEPGDTLGFELALESLAAGKHRLWVSLRLAGDERTDDDRDSLRVRVGPGPLAVTEIQFHPADGEGEWVEILNRSRVAVDPAAFTISDRGSGRGVPSDGAVIPTDSLGVLAQDRAALLALHPELDASRVWQATPWSALNNSEDSTGIADHVVLRESDGLPCDEVAYRSAGVPTGVPIEWRDGAWQPALDPRGSPLGFPRALPPASRRFDLSPARVSDADPRVRIEWALPWPRARVKVTLYDFAGREVARLWPESGAAGRGARDLTLGGVPPGFYWAALEARPESGTERLAETRPLRVVGAR